MKVLVVVDMQNDFVTGVLGTESAQAIVPAVKAKIEEYRNAGNVVIFTRDTHGEDYLTTQEGEKLPVKHCIEDTEGWQIVPQLDAKDSVIVDKPTFGSYKLVDVIAELDPESIELIGVCTDICVISNAMLLKAMFTETPIIIDPDCCAGVTRKSHYVALEAMKACQIEIK